MKYLVRNFTLLLLLGMVTACSTLPRHPAPLDKMLSAKITEMPGVSAWSGTFSKKFEADLLLPIQQEKKHHSITKPGSIPITSVLTLSGGGDIT